MNQLNGKLVNVVLTIDEGRGFGFLQEPIYISATFDGRPIESDPIQPKESMAFNVEYVWETEKKIIRKIRTMNQPLRVECLKLESDNSKRKLGFVLLSLRAAKVFVPGDRLVVGWHKLIGLHHSKEHCPEIGLSLTIQEHKPTTGNSMVEERIGDEPAYKTEIIDDQLRSDVPDLVNVQRMDGFLKIGDKMSERFALSVLVKTMGNLDLLLSEDLVFGETKKDYYLSFTMFGQSFRTKTMSKAPSDEVEMDERIVVSLGSVRETLLDYLNRQKISIIFCCGREKLGVAYIDLSNMRMSPQGDGGEILELSQKCIFKCRLGDGKRVRYDCNAAQPFIDTRTTLASGVNPEILGTGDRLDVPKEKEEHLVQDEICVDEADDIASAVNTTSPQCSDIGLCPTKTSSSSSFYFRKYMLEVAVKSLAITKKTQRSCSLRFQHPRASNHLTNPNPKDEKFNKFRITYVCERDNVDDLLNLCSPTLQLIDEVDGQTLAEHQIDVRRLDSRTRNKSSDDECFQLDTYKAVAYDTREPTEVFAKFEIVMSLTECDVEEKLSKTTFDLQPAVIDEEIAVREIVELEKWRKAKKKEFRKKLRELEDEERERFRGELTLKRAEMEDILARQIEKCEQLQHELKEKSDSLKTENLLKNKRNSIINNFSSNIRDKLADKPMYEAEFLLDIIDKLEIDNRALKQIITEQNEQMRVLEKSTLTKEQTANLLQELRGLEEKFEEARSAKSYFKTQWQKAFKEVHELRTKDLEHLQSELKQSKEALIKMNLEHSESRFSFGSI